MGNINCTKYCQGFDGKTELDLKTSVIKQNYPQVRHSVMKQESQPKEDLFTKFPKSDLSMQASKIQKAWLRRYNRNQYQQFKNLFQPNHEYFSNIYTKETISNIPISPKRKKRSLYTYANGATYKGEWRGGIRDGKGKMIWPDGCIYEGTWDYGIPFGYGKFKHFDGETYEGNWKSPIITQNNSQIESENGYCNKYSGWLYYKQEMLKSLPTEQRSSKFSLKHYNKLKNLYDDFSKIELELNQPTEFINNVFNENFKSQFQEHMYDVNIKYYGEFRGKVREGKGLNIWENGDRYEGLWANDMQNSWGRNVWIDGSTYIGGYKNNLKEGVGKYNWEDGTVYIGQWKTNVINGIGKYMWADGRQYLGEWIDGTMNGFGVFYWKDGKKYEGEWFKGKKHGIGYSISTDGSVSKNKWNYGKMIKKDNQTPKSWD